MAEFNRNPTPHIIDRGLFAHFVRPVGFLRIKVFHQLKTDGISLFNPDGSLKVPEHLKQNKEKLKTQRCIKVKRELASTTPPKKCILHLTLSEAINDNRFISTIYACFNENASVRTKLIKIDEKNFEVHIETNLRRCTDCNSLINKYREFLDGNIVEDKGSCTFESIKEFCYEDYFD